MLDMLHVRKCRGYGSLIKRPSLPSWGAGVISNEPRAEGPAACGLISRGRRLGLYILKGKWSVLGDPLRKELLRLSLPSVELPGAPR